MLRFVFSFAWLIGMSGSVASQNASDLLVAYYSFDDGTADESRDNQASDALVTGAPTAACGAVGGSLLFDGVADYLTIASPEVNDLFENNDFVVSFWFHPTGVNARQTLVRKKSDCATTEAAFSIDYLANVDALEITFAQDATRSLGGANNRVPLNPLRCWQHFTLARRGNELQFFLNGERVARLSGSSRYNIANAANLEIARAGCSATETNFAGFIDELRIYRGALDLQTIESFYTPVDLISPLARPVIDIGEQVRLNIALTCADDFVWTPTETIIADEDTPSPLVMPFESTKYFVELSYPQSGCRATDSVFLQVFDPDNFDCTQLLLPAAFSPDGTGPESNERFGISNAATLQEFDLFEVYDRWGNRVFETDFAAGSWDGTYEGEPAMPGVYLWRVSYRCNSVDLNRTGSVVLMR